MAITRRQALASAGAAALASSLAKPAIAAKEPVLMGYLPALTGPSSSTGIGVTDPSPTVRCASDGVPTIQPGVRIKMVGTAQERLCPPYMI